MNFKRFSLQDGVGGCVYVCVPLIHTTIYTINLTPLVKCYIFVLICGLTFGIYIW